MRLNGRRFSNNVSDQRGNYGGTRIAGISSIGGLIIVGIIIWLAGGNPISVLDQSTQFSTADQIRSNYTPSEKEEEYANFASQILAATEDMWSEEFKKLGLTYRMPKMVLYTGSVSSACGNATSSVGPFYCPGDETIYLDLSFFEEMEKQMNAGGDFAYAYVIAHEVGHHVQKLLGTLDKSHSAQASSSKVEANRISVRTELQADFYAGMWANHDHKRFNSLEEGDIEEALNAASKIGDDYLQKMARGYAVPETFNHGTSAQRINWLKRGLTSGEIRYGDTFSPAYSAL